MYDKNYTPLLKRVGSNGESEEFFYHWSRFNPREGIAMKPWGHLEVLVKHVVAPKETILKMVS